MLKTTREKHVSETYLELSQTSNMELLQKIANCFKSFFIFTKSSILFLCTTLYILTNKCFIVQKNTGKIVLQYLMKHSNIAHSPFITIKYKKFANNDILKNSEIQKNGWSRSLFFCYTVLKSMLSNVSVLITRPN